MDRCPKDETTAEIFFGIKVFPIPKENRKNLLVGGINPQKEHVFDHCAETFRSRKLKVFDF